MKSFKIIAMSLILSSEGAHAIKFEASDFDTSSNQMFFNEQKEILNLVNNGWFWSIGIEGATAPFKPAAGAMIGISSGIEKRFFGIFGTSFEIGGRSGNSVPEDSAEESEGGYYMRMGIPFYAATTKHWALGIRPAYELGRWTSYEKTVTTQYGYKESQFNAISLRSKGPSGSLFVTFHTTHLECGISKNIGFSSTSSSYTAEALTKWCLLAFKLVL